MRDGNVHTRCRIPGCETHHDRTLFCCRRHWRMLPEQRRAQIQLVSLVFGEDSPQYRAAARRAIGWLELEEYEQAKGCPA